MSTQNYSRLAAAIFTIIAFLQLLRAIFGWEVTFVGVSMPVWPSWIAFIVAAVLAWLGFTAKRD